VRERSISSVLVILWNDSKKKANRRLQYGREHDSIPEPVNISPSGGKRAW
jgi:hypothetical protein